MSRLEEIARERDAIADARRYVTEFPHSIEAFGSSSMKAVLDQHDREVERLQAIADDAYEVIDAATQWAVGGTGIKSMADLERHIKGYDALLDGQVRLGVALGKLQPLLAAPPGGIR